MAVTDSPVRICGFLHLPDGHCKSAAWPLTYYESGSMFPSRDNIIDPDWKAFYERVAKDIADRQKKFYNY